MEKECTCIHIYVLWNHFAVQQKLTQHCKSTLLKFKIFLKIIKQLKKYQC